MTRVEPPEQFPTPTATDPLWRVEIPMPALTCRHRGCVVSCGAGSPAGWSDMNTTSRGGVRASIKGTQVKAAWRRAAYTAFTAARIPPQDRVYLQFQTRGWKGDAHNLGLTVKPVVDALGPMRVQYPVDPRTDQVREVVYWGAGVVPDDTDRYVLYGAQLPKLPPVKDLPDAIVVWLWGMPPDPRSHPPARRPRTRPTTS